MPKLPTFKQIYIPKDVEFVNDDGKLIPNSEFPVSEQVKCELTYASLEQKSNYMQTYSETGKNSGKNFKIKTENKYNKCLEKHVIKIENLFDEKGKIIDNGFKLVRCSHPGLNEFKQDLFYRINAIRFDEDVEDDGPGELTEGEN